MRSIAVPMRRCWRICPVFLLTPARVGWCLYIAVQQCGDTAATTQTQQALTSTAGNPVLCGLILEALGASLKVKLPPLAAAASSPTQAIDGLARACDLFRALGRPLT